MAVRDGLEVVGLSFDYGQRHSRELQSAQAIAQRLGIRQLILSAPLGQIGGSALTDSSLAVPSAGKTIGADIPITYVPARNTVFLSLALAVAEVEGAQAIYIGANALDYSGYPDCRPEYLAAFEKMANLATKQGVEGKPIRIEAPLLAMTKAQIIQTGTELGAPYELTWSCYRGGERACGTCESCVLRLQGFKEAGVPDRVPYEVR